MNPCKECLVQAACNRHCVEFEIYLRENLPDRWVMWSWHIGGDVRRGRCKLLYLGKHIFNVEGF